MGEAEARQRHRERPQTIKNENGLEYAGMGDDGGFENDDVRVFWVGGGQA